MIDWRSKLRQNVIQRTKEDFVWIKQALRKIPNKHLENNVKVGVSIDVYKSTFIDSPDREVCPIMRGNQNTRKRNFVGGQKVFPFAPA